MKVEVRLFASLSEYSPQGTGAAEMELPEETTVGDLLGRLGVPADMAKVIFVNGVHASHDKRLRQGDRVRIFPPVAGG